MPFKYFLLSNFTDKTTNGIDTEGNIQRYQALSIIIISLGTLLSMTAWKIMDLFVFPFPADSILITTTPLFILALFLLKRGQKSFAAALVLAALHLGNYLAANFCNIPMLALFAINIFAGMSFFISSSRLVHLLNVFLCFIQTISHGVKVRKIFSTVLTEDQEFQIIGLQFTAIVCLAISLFCWFLRTNIESNLREAAQRNFDKTENINKELLEAVEAKDTFVSSLSHEIRNPLNCINGSLNFLLKVIKEPSYIQVLNSAALSGEVLLNLVNNVLDAAKLKSERMEVTNMETSPAETLKKALTINAQPLKDKNIFVQAFIYKNVPKNVWVDPSRLLQVLMNLLSNAVKFTNKNGKIKVHITWCEKDSHKEKLLKLIDCEMNQQHVDGGGIKGTEITAPDQNLSTTDIKSKEFNNLEIQNHLNNLKYLDGMHPKNMKSVAFSSQMDFPKSYTPWMIYNPQETSFTEEDENVDELFIGRPGLEIPENKTQENGYLKIQVTDNGCGIAEKNKGKLFDMFTQADRTITSRYGGTGLGLWICKQLCHKMGGDIRVYSKEGMGTSFVFYLPVTTECLAQSPMYPIARSRERVKALVVDDFAFNRDLHRLILEREGVQVVLACNGVEAVEKFIKSEERKDGFDFILMDVQMPEMDGFTAASKIREWEKERNGKNVRICFVSGEYYGEAEVYEKLKIKKGGNEGEKINCLKKPIDVEIIRNIVNKYSKNSVTTEIAASSVEEVT